MIGDSHVVDVRHDTYPQSPWDKCPLHVWKEAIDSMYSNEYSADVTCTKCGCPGAQDRDTKSTFWPAT